MDYICHLCQKSVVPSNLHLKRCIRDYNENPNNNLRDPIYVQYYTFCYIFNNLNYWDVPVTIDKPFAFKIYWYFICKATESRAECGIENNFLLDILNDVRNIREIYLNLIPQTNLSEFEDEGIYREHLYLIFSRPQIFDLKNGNNI